MTITANASRPVVLSMSGIFAAAACALVAVTLAGCSAGMPANQVTTTVTPSSTTSSGIKGILHGGQSPVVGSHVYLFAVGTSGYKSAATSLLTTGAGSDSYGNYVLSTAPDGGFSVSGDYSCPTPGPSLIYLLATQGNAGSGNNASLSMMALLGDCATITNAVATTGVFITINEVSTVAAAYALAPFATSPGVIGTSSTNYAGIQNAFNEVPNFISPTYGSPYVVAQNTSGNGAVPASLIDTLANIIASCVNSNGAGTSAPGGCTQLFTATGASDTFSAAVAIAQNPGSSTMTALTALSTPQAPFQPSLSATPNDLTMPVVYTGGGISTPKSVAIDANGNAWVASATNTITELSAATGSFVSGSTGYTSTAFDSPESIAIDTASPANVWVVNCGGQCSGSANVSNVSTLTSAGGAVTNTFSASGSPLSLSGAYGLAIDGTNKAWVTNALGKSIATFTAAGGLQSGTTGLTATFQSNPIAVAIDGSGNAWAVSPSSANVTEFLASSGTRGVQGSPLTYPSAVAIDRRGNGWVLDQSQSQVYSVAAGGATIGSPISGGGLNRPNAIAFDGNNVAWIANSNGSLSAVSSTSGSALTTATGLQPGSAYANSIAIDFSGTVWVTSCGTYCTGVGSDPGSVYQIIGLATPAVTPLATAVANNTIAQAP